MSSRGESRAAGRTLSRLPAAVLCGALLGAALPALAQGGGAGLLAPPSLPPALSGGAAALPGLPGASPQDVLQRLLDAGSGRGAAGALPAPVVQQPLPPPTPAQPPAAAAPPPALPEEPLSNTEAFFAARLEGAPLRQFGYDTFRAPPAAMAVGLTYGALPDDYLIGRDDEVVLAFRGRARQTLTLRVTRDGTLLLPDLPPIPAAGRTLKELRADLESRAARDLGGSEVFVSIGQVRQMTVFVAGEVVRPGFQPLTALASVLDALAAAGGVRKTGSLRAVRVEGARGSRTVDLYAVIAGAPGTPDLSLREGERVVVPPLGGVVALGGDVTRPAIYELPARSGAAPLDSLLLIAGGALRPAGNRYLVQQTDQAGRRSFSEIAASGAVRRGDAVIVQPAADVAANVLRLTGHVTTPLTRPAAGRHGSSLRALIADPRLMRSDPYVRVGVVWRADPRTRARGFVPFDLGRVLEGRGDMLLQDGDEVLILARSDIRWLTSPTVQRALRGEVDPAGLPAPPPQAAPATPAPGAVPAALPPGVAPATPAALVAPGTPAMPSTGCLALTQLAIAARASPQRFAHARGAGFPDLGTSLCPQIFQDYPDLLAFLLDQAVIVTGEARFPGLYPIVDDTGLDLVLASAGGLSDATDLTAVEFAREPANGHGAMPLARLRLDLRSNNFSAVRLSPRDAVRFPRGLGDRDTGPVTLVGEFQRPGIYDIRRGERLSEVIARAGGLTLQAYPYGAVFSRESVRQRQQEGFERTARELETSLIQVAAGQAVAGTRGASVDVGSAIAAGRELAGTLRQARAAGRMVVEANPVILAARPELDVLLEPGDLIAMPKRPNEVTVVGAVLNPGSLQFRSGWRARDYVRAAGDTQRFADPSRSFVVLPNGQSVPAGLSAWQQGGPPVPPGSLVVVPQDPSPYETWGFVRDLTQVLGQVSVSAAALAVVAREAAR